MKLVENMILKYTKEIIIRILYYDNFNGNVFVINLIENKWPYLISIDKLNKDIENNQASILEDDDYYNRVKKGSFSDSIVSKRDLAWDIVCHILKETKEPNIYHSKYRTPILKETIESYKISFNTIKNYLIRYWKGGKTRDGLLPKYYNCGGKGSERKSGDKKRGRPNVYGKKKGVNIDDSIKKMFKSGLNKYYYNDRQNSIKIAYELTIRDYFVKDYITNGDKQIAVMEDASRIPTYNQFYYWYKKSNNYKKEIYKRKGERIFNQNYRGIIGNSISDGELGPATLWQIDSTICDVYLVSSMNPNLIIGRPVLYFVIDVYSRMIVGLNVTLESFNSYIGGMMALINSMTPKLDYCKRFEVDIVEKSWPISCVPQKILADRGELMGAQIENAITNLGITIQNTPPYRADYKGIIEQSFRGINLKLKPFVDGAVVNGKNLKQRGERDYRLNSNLTLKEFTKIIIKCVLFHNNHHVLGEYVTSEMMVENEVEKIPIKIWNHGIENKSGMLRRLDDDVIKMNLLPHSQATVTPKGVVFNKLAYASSNSLRDGWFQTARSNGSWKIEISYDPRDLTNIYYLDDKGRNFEKLTLLDYLYKYKEIESSELEQIFKYEKEIEIKSKDKELCKKITLFNEIEEIVKEARKQSNINRNDNISKTQRLKNIGENNQIEKELQKTPIILEEKSYSHAAVQLDNNPVDENNDNLELFRQIQNESWDDYNG